MNEFLDNPGLHALDVIHELAHARNGGDTDAQHPLREALSEVRKECAQFVPELE